MPQEPKPWEISITGFAGLAPGYWKNSIITVGNRGHASAATAIDLTDPNVLKPGPGLSDLTGAVTTAIRGIQRVYPPSTGIQFAIGGNQLYSISASGVLAAHTIDKAAVTGEDGWDACEYKGESFYSYNHSGTAGDIGRYASAAYDDDYMSTVPVGAAALQGGVPHQMIVGGDDRMYIANGRFVASFYIAADGTRTFVDQALDLPFGETVVSIAWNHNRLYVGTNRGSSNRVLSSIYIWDTTSSSWEYQITLQGQLGGMYSAGSRVHAFYTDGTSSENVYRLAVLNPRYLMLQDVAFVSGTLPQFYQIGEWFNHVVWTSDSTLWAWGAAANGLPTKLFPLMSLGTNATAGGLSTMFGFPIIGFQDGSSAYHLAKNSNYSLSAAWKSITFDVGSAIMRARAERVTVYTDPITSGGRLDTTLVTDYGAQSKALSAITATDTRSTKHVILRDSIDLDNFRLELSWANGSATNPVVVRKIVVRGSYLEDA